MVSGICACWRYKFGKSVRGNEDTRTLMMFWRHSVDDFAKIAQALALRPGLFFALICDAASALESDGQSAENFRVHWLATARTHSKYP